MERLPLWPCQDPFALVAGLLAWLLGGFWLSGSVHPGQGDWTIGPSDISLTSASISIGNLLEFENTLDYPNVAQ
jgi:hypothetical protein